MLINSNELNKLRGNITESVEFAVNMSLHQGLEPNFLMPQLYNDS